MWCSSRFDSFNTRIPFVFLLRRSRGGVHGNRELGFLPAHRPATAEFREACCRIARYLAIRLDRKLNSSNVRCAERPIRSAWHPIVHPIGQWPVRHCARTNGARRLASWRKLYRTVSRPLAQSQHPSNPASHSRDVAMRCLAGKCVPEWLRRKLQRKVP